MKQIREKEQIPKKKDKSAEVLSEEGKEKQVSAAIAELDSLEQVIDDIISEFSGDTKEAQVIKESDERPQLRKEAAEEFVKAFRQRQGE